MDIGFSGLAYSPERNACLAVSYVGSLWAIEPQLGAARKIHLSGTCTGYAALRSAGGGSWRRQRPI